MPVLVLFDVPDRQARARLQKSLSRDGFQRVFPNVYEGSDAVVPSLQAAEREIARLLRGQVYRLRIYKIARSAPVIERWGS